MNISQESDSKKADMKAINLAFELLGRPGVCVRLLDEVVVGKRREKITYGIESDKDNMRLEFMYKCVNVEHINNNKLLDNRLIFKGTWSRKFVVNLNLSLLQRQLEDSLDSDAVIKRYNKSKKANTSIVDRFVNNLLGK